MLKSHEKFHSSNGKRLILAADDELINRELLGMVLENEYEVIYAADGQETLDQVEKHREDLSLVLLDLMMPVKPGLEVLKEMKADPALRHIPVIVLTADQNAEIESLAIGAIDYIPKPYPQPGIILARILRAIELSEDREIIQQTERDPLTGLYNREYFYRYAEQFEQHHRDMEMDAIVVDINHFHMINERFGNAYGDEVLRRIGERLRESVGGEGGIVCRREADTFMIFCPHGMEYKDILENASIGLSEDESVNSRVRLRMGVYAKVDKKLEVERRFDRAKMAADTVRNSFTKTIGVYDNTMHERELYAEQLIDDFHQAIEEKQFKVYFQPKYDVRPKAPVLTSAEALVRWQHPKLGLISPGFFIPLFEDNGLIQEVDNYVWRETARQQRSWKEKFGFIVPVSVNVSRIDMYDPNLIGKFEDILRESGLRPEDIYLEITESAYTQDSGQIIETVNELRRIGFKIEMDDFGTGYSSLNMISALPIDALKLDMQFVRSAFKDQKDTRMLEVIIDIADHLSVPVIAEGVETEEQLVALKDLGCDIVQGYYFSKPVPPEEFEPFLEVRRKVSPEQLLPEATETAEANNGTTEEAAPEKPKRAFRLRMINYAFAILALIITSALMLSDMMIYREYGKLTEANEHYIRAQQAAEDSAAGSDELLLSAENAVTGARASIQGIMVVQMVLLVLLALAILGEVIFITVQVRIPLTRMVQTMRLQQRVEPAGAEELQFVTRTYNEILEENRKAHQQLSYEASHDPLTGLMNRHAYEVFLEHADLEHIALLVIDVDNFKKINDTHGHDMGDRILKRVAEVLTQSFRSVDAICRLGGDEFVVVMTRANSTMRQLVINKISRANNLLEHPKDGLPEISLSVGVAFSDRENPKGDIFQDADSALYSVKGSGRAGCAVYGSGVS